MKWELDDNSRNGFQYLLFGALVIAVGVGLNLLIDHLITPIGPGGSFAHGYLIGDDGRRLILAQTSRAERLATAALLAFVIALCMGGAVAAIGRVLRRSWKPIALLFARFGFLLAVCYFAYAALLLPPQELIGQRDGMLIIWQRKVMLNDLPWPAEKHIALIPFATIDRVTTEDVIAGDRKEHRVIARLNNGVLLPLGNSTGTDGANTAVAAFAQQRTALLNSWLHAP